MRNSGLRRMKDLCYIKFYLMIQQNKITLVTGGSRGLGKDMALKLAANGHQVVLTYQSKKEEALDVVKAIEEKGGKAAALQLNVGETGSFNGFVAAFSALLQSKFEAKSFDYLVNNAGANFQIPSFAATTEEQFDALMNMHFKGVFFLTQQLLPLLNDNGGIVNLSSALTRSTFPGSGAYASMKGAMEVLTKYLARELGARGINVNIVAPGAVPTDFSGGRLKGSPEMQQHIIALTAIPRLASPEDIGGIVAFLCSPEAAWITAQRIEASGGIHL